MPGFDQTVHTKVRPGTTTNEALVDTRSAWERAVDDGEAFTIESSTVAPTGANDAFLYVQNVHTTKRMIVDDISLHCVAADTILAYLVAVGTRNAGTLVPVWSTKRGGPLASSYIAAENGVDLAGGASTLSLTAANLVGRLRLTTANVEGSISGRRASYVLPAGTALLLVAVTGTANITGTVSVHFEA